MKLIKRFPDNYNKNEDSNISKLLSIFDFESDRINETFRTIDDYRHISNATGTTLDKIGKNVLLERDGMDDITYRLFLRLKIKMNLSGGQIKTISEIMQAILGKHFLGLREVWNNPTYDNEPAAFEIRFSNFFMDIIGNQLAESENDPFFFNGEYFFDSARVFNGGYIFDFSQYEAQMVEILKKYIGSVDFIRAAGVKAWWCEPLDIETLINIENDVTIVDKESAIADISIANNVTLSEQTEVINGATSLFDGMFYFDGAISFDGNRDFVVNDVIITEVSA